MNPFAYPSSVDNFEDTLRTSDSYVYDMLSFYQEGWSARGQDDLAKLEKRVKANLITTLTYMVELFNYALSLNINPLSVFLKLNNPTSIFVLFAVSDDDYVNRKLSEIYKTAHKIEKATKSESFRVNFSIISDSEDELNIECLNSDGYFKIDLPPRELFQESTRTA